jgi:hypothetical protein
MTNTYESYANECNIKDYLVNQRINDLLKDIDTSLMPLSAQELINGI